MKIHYGGEISEFGENRPSGKSFPSHKTRQTGKRVTVRSSGSSHAGVHLRMPEENLTDLNLSSKASSGCSLCQMARTTGTSSVYQTASERASAPQTHTEMLEAFVESGMCTFRLPVREARYFGQLLLDAALEAEKKVSPEEDETRSPIQVEASSTLSQTGPLANREETQESPENSPIITES